MAHVVCVLSEFYLLDTACKKAPLRESCLRGCECVFSKAPDGASSESDEETLELRLCTVNDKSKPFNGLGCDFQGQWMKCQTKKAPAYDIGVNGTKTRSQSQAGKRKSRSSFLPVETESKVCRNFQTRSRRSTARLFCNPCWF